MATQPPAGAPPAAPPPGAPPAAPATPPPGAPPAAQNIGTVAIGGGAKMGGFDAGTYAINPDGSITILTSGDAGGKANVAGKIVTPDGKFLNADGTPFLAGGQQVWSARGANGDPATTNPNFKGDSGGIVNDLITKDNPIAGTLNAANDIVHGRYKQAASDFGAGTSGGTLPQVDANGNIVPGDTTKAAATEAGVPSGVPGVTSPVTGPGGIGDDLSGLLKGLGVGGGGSSSIDASSADAETARANALADALGTQAQTASGQADADRALGGQTREQQQQSIQGLQDAAAGKVPSAAEMQLNRQSGIDAARQQGLAAALQGSNPAAALRQASMGAAKVAGDTSANAAALRATEQANARNALATTLGNVRTQDQGAVNTDVTQQGNLTSGQLTSQGQGVTSTGQKLSAEAAKAQADAAREGAIAGAIGTGAAALIPKLSDKRAKKDIVKASLADALGKGVHGVTFEYKPESGEDDEPHFGVLAQELEKVMPGTVKKRPDGMRVVDTGHVTLGNTAVLAELADRLMALEKKGGRK